MAVQNIKGLTGLRGLSAKNVFVEGTNTTDGVIAMAPATTLADLPSTVRGYAFQSTTPYYWNGTTWSSLSAAGGIPSWDDVYGNDKTLTINSTTLTFSLTHATNDGLTITGAAGSAGDCLQFTNSGTGSDIKGTSDTWSVSKAGAAVFTAITGCDTLTAAANMAIDATGAGTITLAGTSTGAITLTTATTCSAALTVGTTLTVGTGATFSDGLVDIIDNANNASGLRVTNDTITTYGNAADAGVVVLRSESLTTGTLLHLSIDETGMAGGYFFRCWSQDLGSAAFTIGEYGVTTIAGPAAGGSAALTITAGDVAFSDASLTITDADNAATLDITNNTATTIGAAASSGVVTIISTSLTTGALLNLELTEGTLTTGWYLRMWDATGAAAVWSVGEDGATIITSGSTSAIPLTITANSATTVTNGLINLDANALTTGHCASFSTTSNAIAAGTIAQFDHTAAGITADKTAQLINIVASRTVTAAAARSDDYDAVSIVRTNVCNNAGATLASAGSVLYIQNVGTQTAGALTDTTNGIELTMTGGTEAAGVGLKITHTNTTTATGYAIDIAASHTTRTVMRMVADGLTTGYGVSLEHGTAVIAAGGSILSIASTSVDTTTTTGALLTLSSNASAAATQVSGTFSALDAGIGLSFVTAALTTGTMALFTCNSNAMTSGIGVSIASTGTGLTSGSLLRVSSGTTGAVATNGIVSIRATGAYTSTSYVGLLDVSAAATTAGTVVRINGTLVTDGNGLVVSLPAITTGYYLRLTGAAAATMFTIGVNGATTITGVAGSTELTVTAGDVSIADGSITIADNDNAATLSITNDTATTIGAAANAGVIDISGDGLTTGTLLNLSVTEGTLTTGHYMKCWDVTGAVMTYGIAEDGETFLAGGTAITAGGADAINIGAAAAIKVLFGSGAPTANAPQGSLYMRTDGSSTTTRVYINTDGAGTWTNITTAA